MGNYILTYIYTPINLLLLQILFVLLAIAMSDVSKSNQQHCYVGILMELQSVACEVMQY